MNQMNLPRATREAKSRIANSRQPLKDPRAFGNDISVPGYTLKWVRKFFNGAQEDRSNFFSARQMGWEPVRVEELPDKFALLKDSEGYVSKDGCILCKLDAETAANNVAYYEQMAINNATATAKSFVAEDGNNRIMPRTIEANKTRVLKVPPSA